MCDVVVVVILGGVVEESPCASELSVYSDSANSSPALTQVVTVIHLFSAEFFSTLAKRSAGQSVSEMICFVSSETQNLKSVN